MSRKKVRSSLGVVSTEREGSSILCAVKGTEVSIVRVVESPFAADEIGRRRGRVHEKAAVSGLRILDRDGEVAMCDRVISIVGFVPAEERERSLSFLREKVFV
jgi:hypothetical protein